MTRYYFIPHSVVVLLFFSFSLVSLVINVEACVSSPECPDRCPYLGNGWGCYYDNECTILCEYCGEIYPVTEAEDCDWGDTNCINQPHLPLTDDIPPDYENVGIASFGEAYYYRRGFIDVVESGTPEAQISISPDVYLKEVSEDFYCFKTLLLDLDICEVIGGSVDNTDYDLVSSKERATRQFERDEAYSFNYGSNPIARCYRTADLGRGVTEQQEMQLVITPTNLVVAAQKPSYSCSQYATEQACQSTGVCEWDEVWLRCEFVPYEGFTEENQVMFWLMEPERCYALDIYGAGSTYKWTLINDPAYKALVEHYHSRSGFGPLTDPPPEVDADDLPKDLKPSYHVELFFGADEVYATFFEKWAKHYIKELGGMDESERLYCYKTDLWDTSYCYELPYHLYSFLEDNSLVLIDDVYINNIKLWNDFQYINEMPAKNLITYDVPGINVVYIMGPPLEDEERLWHGLWIKFFTVSPMIQLSGAGGASRWAQTRVETEEYVGSGMDRRDACEYSCVYTEEESDNPCRLLEECDPFDPMDDDETQYEHCPNENPHYDLCSGFDSDEDPDSVDQIGSCSIYRGVDDECVSDTGDYPTCLEWRVNPPSASDCWGGLNEVEPCEVISQYQLMRDCPPEECRDAGYGQGGFEKVEVPWYERIWGSGNEYCVWKLLSQYPDCTSCLEGSQGVGYTIVEQKQEAPGPLCLTKYILEGGVKATTTIKIRYNGSLTPDEVYRVEIHNISDNIWMTEFEQSSKPYFKLIDTADIPFQVTCAYLVASPRFDCEFEAGCSNVQIVRYMRSKMGRWSRLTLDSDVLKSDVINDIHMNVEFEVKQDYLTGLREDRFYTACDRLNCNCEECLCPCKCPEIHTPTYQFILADSNTGYNDDVCGGVSEKVMLLCPCPLCCYPPRSSWYDMCWHQWREEIKSWYHEQTTSTISDSFEVFNWEKEGWVYNSPSGEDEPIEHYLELDATRYKDGDIISTQGFINFTISPNIFRGMELYVNDSEGFYHKLISVVGHYLTRKKSSPLPDTKEYKFDSRYGYELDRYGYPEQCKKICEPPPRCECDPSDITAPLCYNMDLIVYRADIEDLLCEYYSDDPVVTRICDDGSITDDQQIIDDLCTRYLNEVGVVKCELDHNRVYCFDQYMDDDLYMACYGDHLTAPEDCVCTPDKRYDNPCTSERDFHEDEGSIIVNGDFEMGFQSNKLGPWDGDGVVFWMGRNGYALQLADGQAVEQQIPEYVSNDPANDMLCLEYGVDSFVGGGEIHIVIIENTEEDGRGDELARYTLYAPEDCPPDLSEDEKYWIRACVDGVPEKIPGNILRIEVGGNDFVIDNINVGKYYDFVVSHNEDIENMTWSDQWASQSSAGIYELMVNDIDHGSSDSVFPGGHYYTIYFKSLPEPFRELPSSSELYDVISKQAFMEGSVKIHTYYMTREIPLSSADKFKIRDAMELTYWMEPDNLALFPGTEVTVKLKLYNLDEKRGESGKRVYVWSSDVADLSALSPSGLSEEDGQYYVVTGADGTAEFTIVPSDTVSLEIKHFGDEDPSGHTTKKVLRVNVLSIYTPFLSPQTLVLLLILIVAAFSYKFLGVGRMQLEGWLDDLRGKK